MSDQKLDTETFDPEITPQYRHRVKLAQEATRRGRPSKTAEKDLMADLPEDFVYRLAPCLRANKNKDFKVCKIVKTKLGAQSVYLGMYSDLKEMVDKAKLQNKVVYE